LLSTLFDGFDFVKERAIYETDKEGSLFYYKWKVVRELKNLDRCFEMASEEAEAKEIGGEARLNYRAVFEGMRHEKYRY
jgi:hypothetical protein